MNSFPFEVPCPEECNVSRTDFASGEDQIGTCSFESEDRGIVYDNFGIQFKGSDSENSLQNKKSLTKILNDEQVNENKCSDSVDDIQSQDSFVRSDQSKDNVNDNVKYCVDHEKDPEKDIKDDSLAKYEETRVKELTSNGQDNEINKIETKQGHCLHSDSNKKEQNSVDHLISRGKLLSIENRTRLKKERKTLRPKKKLRNSNANRCKITSKKKPVFCSDCQVTFTSQKRYDRHKERNGGQCVFACEFCDKVFLYRKSRYDLHVRSAHSKERPYKCDVCQKGYLTSDKLKIHKRVHTGKISL